MDKCPSPERWTPGHGVWVTESPHLQKESSFIYMRGYKEIKQLGVRMGWGWQRQSVEKEETSRQLWEAPGWLVRQGYHWGCGKVTVNKVSILQVECMKFLLLNFWKQDFPNSFFDQLCPWCFSAYSAWLPTSGSWAVWKRGRLSTQSARAWGFLSFSQYGTWLSLCLYTCVCVSPCVLLCVTRTWVCKPVYTCRSQNKSPVQSALRQDLSWPRVLGEADCPVSSQDWLVFALQCWSHRHSEHAAFLTWWPRNSDSGRHAFRVFFFSEPILGLSSSQCHHTQFRGPFFPKNNCCRLCWDRGRETRKERATCFLNISGR